MNDQAKKLIKYVIPTMLGSISFFLFTIVDGIFVGQGVGTNALGAVNIVGDCLLIFPLKMGVAGAAIATAPATTGTAPTGSGATRRTTTCASTPAPNPSRRSPATWRSI